MRIMETERALDSVGGSIEMLDRAFAGIVIDAIDWIYENHNEKRYGTRKITHLLKGTNNSDAIELSFADCPYRGALSFLSIRKIEKILTVLKEQQVLKTVKSPQLQLPVLAIENRGPIENLDIIKKFSLEKCLDLGAVDKKLFYQLKSMREEIRDGRHKESRKHFAVYQICTDDVLIQLCIDKPSNILEFRDKINGADKLLDAGAGKGAARRFIETINRYESSRGKIS